MKKFEIYRETEAHSRLDVAILTFASFEEAWEYCYAYSDATYCFYVGGEV